MEIRDKIIAKYEELAEMYEMELIIGQSHKRKNRVKRQIASLKKELQEQKPILKTSEEWAKNYPYTIYDPDGWDRKNYEFSWFKELITFEEFKNRALRSTCIGIEQKPQTAEKLICPKCKKILKYTDGNVYDPQNRDDPNYYCKCGFKIYINIDEYLKIIEKEQQEQHQRTAEEILNQYPTFYYDTKSKADVLVYIKADILRAMEEYASQFQQPEIKTNVIKYRGYWTVKFTIGYQSFTLAFKGNKEEASLLKDQLITALKAQRSEITDEEIEKWAEKWELNNKVFEDTIMPFIKTGLVEGAKAMRDNEIG